MEEDASIKEMSSELAHLKQAANMQVCTETHGGLAAGALVLQGSMRHGLAISGVCSLGLLPASFTASCCALVVRKPPPSTQLLRIRHLFCPTRCS